jgi:hypothetical protein
LLVVAALVPGACLAENGTMTATGTGGTGTGGTGTGGTGGPGTGGTAGTGGTGNGGTGGIGGGGVGGSGGSSDCTPGATQNCTTNLKGICAAGTQVCNADGTGFEACNPIATPTFDDCATAGVDEDCDGNAPACTGAPVNVEPVGSAGSGGMDDDEVGFAVATTGTTHVVVGIRNGHGWDYGTDRGELYVVKYGDGLNVEWQKSYVSSGGYAAGRAVAIDSNGNIVVAGEFKGTLDIEGTTLASGNSIDAFLAKFGPNGALQWALSYGDANSVQAAHGVAVNGDNDIFVIGHFQGAINFGSGVMNADGRDVFVAKIGPGGNGSSPDKWARRYNGNDKAQTGWSIAAAPDGNLVVAGDFDGSMDFGVGGSLSTKGWLDVFVAKISKNDGGGIWRRQFGDGYEQRAYSVSVGKNGDVALAGRFAGTIDTQGAGTITAANGFDAFVIDLAADGATRWAKAFGDAGDESCESVSVDGAGHVLMSGRFEGSLPIGAPTLQSKGATDIYVARLDAADGTPLWSKSFGGPGYERCWSVEADPQGNALVTGGFDGTVDFGNPAGSVTSTGNNDLFLLELAP